MNILLVYPQFPNNTFWSYKYALKFIYKKAIFPPLGLLTVAALLPQDWEQKLVDMNVEKLTDRQIKWADYVFISAMSLQMKSVRSLIARCKLAGKKIVAGGPLFTSLYDQFDDVDHLVLNEAELTLPMFIKDMQTGQPRHIYSTNEWAKLKETPLPLWNLINMKKYSSMNIQYSRGCPFNCEFCDIIVLYGHKPRLKSTVQIIAELESLYSYGWRGDVFFVDDNFIGNKEVLIKEVLPAIIQWMRERNYPYSFCTEASINLADDEELMQLMVKAGFNTVFIGVESPNEESLAECNKNQNRNRDLIECINKIQRSGLQVQGGFIVGFDKDPESIFDTLISFIQETNIVIAMVGLLNAPKGTKLYNRLEKEGRLAGHFSGDNTDYSMNFLPKMNYSKLISGYKKIVQTIYSPRFYYPRIINYLKTNKVVFLNKQKMNFKSICAFLRSVFKLGILGKERFWYWKLVFWTIFYNARLLPQAITFAILGYHFRRIYYL